MKPEVLAMVNKAVVLIAVVCFVLAAFGVSALGVVQLVPLGLALWAATTLL